MATDVITTIGATSTPTTPTYSTIQAWEDDIPANIVSLDQRHIGECLDQGTFSPAAQILISGTTTDATRNIILRCATGASFKDKAGVRTTALLYNASNGVSIAPTTGLASVSIQTGYTRLEGLQIFHAGSYNATIVLTNIGGCTIDSCIIKDGATGTSAAIAAGTASTHKFINCFIEFYASGGIAVSANGIDLYGCTVVKVGTAGGTGLGSLHSDLLVKNCAVFNFTTLKTGTLKTGTDFNATDDATGFGVGSNNVTSLTFANQFENSASDFRAKSTGGLQAGTPDATNTPDDITGETRDATTPWIGAWEVAGGGGVVLPALDEGMLTGGLQILGGGLF